MAKNVADVSLLMSVIAGHDRRDSTSYDRPYCHAPSAKIDGLRIGIPKEYFGAGVDREVAAVVKRAIGRLEELEPKLCPAASRRWSTRLLPTM